MNKKNLKTWLIEPRDPLVFRDGKPFTSVPGARAKSVPFPYPSTLAGAVRTRSAALQHGGVFPAGNKQVIERILGYQIVGPFLYNLNTGTLLLPAPQDALFVYINPSNESEARLIPLQPTEAFNDVRTNLPDGLQLIAPVEATRAKGHHKAPRFWNWSKLEAWLKAPRVHERVTLSDWGLENLPLDFRTHVSIKSDTRTAKEGMLFQTGGLSFTHAPIKGHRVALAEAAQFTLLIQTDAQLFDEGVDSLGGERRIVFWRQAEVELPTCPAEVRQQIVEQRRGRLVLATPAFFEKGFLPTWVLNHPSEVKLRIVAAAVSRPVHISGWDYKEKAPKPTRRLAPAGSVYFFEVVRGDEAAIGHFIDAVWMQPISDEEQARRDGFGVALLGTWEREEV